MFLKKKRFKYETNNKKHLDRILDLAEQIIINSKSNEEKYKNIHLYINTIGNTTLQQLLMQLFRGEEVTHINELFFDIGFYISNNGKNIMSILADENNESFEVDLTEDFVIPIAWNRNRFISNLTHIGKEYSNPFKFIELNHYSYFFKPINITIMTNGNHSTLAGILKKEGKIKPTKIVNLNDRYKEIKFDGTYYRNINTNEILHEVKNFELGAIFEIGRLITENNIKI
ncbi:TPA: hypothetical protein LA827_001821 [Clostridium botulinum]|nr:hypothetical protein [Clostridium botulinum]